MKKDIFRLYSKQNGFTILELVIGLAIAGLVGTGITTTVFQVYSISAQNSAHMTAVKQIENAVHWLNRDVQMAWTVTPTGGTFPLTLYWEEWDSTPHTVVYDLDEGGVLRLSHSIDGGVPAERVIAHSIDPAGTNFTFTANRLTVSLTTSVQSGTRSHSETRTVNIVPRPGS